MFSMFRRLAGGQRRSARRCVSAACAFAIEGLESRQLLSTVLEPAAAAPAPYDPPMAALLVPGSAPPDFSLPYLNSLGTYRLSTDPQQVQVLTFFNTWDATSQLVVPQIQQVYDWVQANGYSVTVNLINEAEQDPVVDQYLASNFITVPTLMDRTGVGLLYEVLNVPVTYVIARGAVQYVHTGFDTLLVSGLETEIESILNTPLVSVVNTTVSESAGIANIAVALSNPSSQTVVVDYTVQPGTAFLNVDFVVHPTAPPPNPMQVVFAPGETVQFIQVPIINDVAEELPENFLIALLNPVNAVIGTGNAMGVIIDDDTQPEDVEISISDAEAVEGDAGVTQMTFTVTMTESLAFDVHVQYDTFDVTATGGVDYTSVAAGTLVFAAGETTQTIVIDIIGDVDDETFETFDIVLSNVTRPDDLTVPPAPPLPVPLLVDDTATGTIQDDEPRLLVNDIVITEGDAGYTTATFTVSLSDITTEDVTFEYATGNGTAAVGIDFVGTRALATIPAGDQFVDVTVLVVGDLLAEPDEYFFLRLVDSDQAAIGDAAGQCTILNGADVAPPTPTVFVDPLTVVEVNEGAANAELVFTISLTAPGLDPVVVTYTVTGGTGTPDDDFTPITGTVTIPAGQTSVTVSVPVADDTLPEADETVIITLSPQPTNAILGNATAIGTIRDDEIMPAITIASTFMAEGNSFSDVLVFTVSLSAPSGQVITVDYTTVDGTADASDYGPVAGTLTFAPGATSMTVRVPVYGERMVEDNESFVVKLSNPVAATLAVDTATGTIIDDDRTPLASVRTERGIRIVDGRRARPISFGKYVVGDFGAILTFTVTNVGTRDLRLGKVVVPRGFKLIEGLRSPLAPSESDTFSVQVLTKTPGLRAGHVRFATNDPKARPFNFAVSAKVNDTAAARKARAARALRATAADVLTAKARTDSLFATARKSILADQGDVL